MKFQNTLFLAFLTSASALHRISTNSLIKADSDLGMKLLSKARNLEENGDQDEQEEFSWVAGYSLKFQGCHHVQQWNGDAEDQDDVKIATKRLVRFRLCPSDTCSDTKAAGCKGGYGDYIIDMNTYVNAYFEAKMRQQEQECESYMNYNCNCNDDDGKGDDFNADYCLYDCFMDAGMAQCVDRNPYEDDEQQAGEFEVEQYMECAELEAVEQEEENQNNQDNEGNDDVDENRKLEDAADEDALYVGPFCAEQGGAIFLGVFTDDTCTEFADDYGGKTTFKELTGLTLPYSEESLVGMECVSCVEQQDEDGNNQNENGVGEQCGNLYANAGKCESALPSGTVEMPNNNGCNYIDGIKIVRQDGILDISRSRANPVATAFIVIFAMAFAAMAFYVWYLRMRLGVKKDALM